MKYGRAGIAYLNGTTPTPTPATTTEVTTATETTTTAIETTTTSTEATTASSSVSESDTTTSTTETSAQPTWQKGDVTLDGTVNIADSVRLCRYSAVKPFPNRHISVLTCTRIPW
ncbi:MAG: hypothetical protein ACLSFT_10100 [Ruminococcus callidus]